MSTPAAFQIVKEFEHAVRRYTGAPYAVAVNSCTNALFLCLQWFKYKDQLPYMITIPYRTYVSVPMQIKHAGSQVKFVDAPWRGMYPLEPLPLYDAARRFTSNMYVPGSFMCTSHHWSKILGVQQGGMILHGNAEADDWFRRARFDGRKEGVPPAEDAFPHLGWHMYLSPEIAAEGLVRMAFLKKHNEDLPNDNYPDLSKLDIFK